MKIKKPFFLILSLILAVIVFLLTQRYLIILITCLFLSYLIKPLYDLINSVVDNKSASAILSELIFLTTLVIVIVFVINSLLSRLVSISSPLLAENLISIENMTFLTFNLSQIDFNNPLTQETLLTIGSSIQTVAARTPLLLIDLFLIIFITYYLIKGANTIYDSILRMIPQQSRKNMVRFFKKVDLITKEILYGYFLTALFIALLTFILLNILGVKYSVDYAILSGLASLIPVIGNWIFPIFLSIYFTLNHNYLIGISLLVFAILTSYLIKMFRPIISKARYNIHPILFILGVVAGFYSMGFLGFLIGPILFGILQSGFEELIKKQSI
ncbi:MAG: AI-2E family transporter [Nanoarchaeota archaeon]|nr:AI-2E family transporter [Nanoarchaeota archaeon]